MMKRALLVIGDEKINKRSISLSFAKFTKYAQRLQNRAGLELKVISYAQLLSGQAPGISAPSITVVFFFPYEYWNRNIETYQDGRIYGDTNFGWEFKSFFRKVKGAIEKYYQGKRIKYLNSPQVCFLDRDKKTSKDLLHKSAVPAPRTFSVSSFSDIQRLLNKGLSLYIKPRFGAMGKGITYITKDEVISNFLIRKDKIVSRPSDYNWRFNRIKDGPSFLNTLLGKGFICEQAIEPATFKRRRFDFRLYVLFGKIVYTYAKSSKSKSYVTNWAQGGKIDKRKLILNTLPKTKIIQLERLARKAARTWGLNFAGIDIIFSQDLKRAYVLESNVFPGHEKGFDLMKCLLNSVVK